MITQTELEDLLPQLISLSSNQEKKDLLEALPYVEEYFAWPSKICHFIKSLSIDYQYVASAIVAIGQQEKLFHIPELMENFEEKFQDLLGELLDIEKFHQEIGGIVGYQVEALRLASRVNMQSSEKIQYFAPSGTDLSKDNATVREAIISGIQNLGKMAEIYPVGGSADRLALKDKKTNMGLPAARLKFLGTDLLEGLILDLQAKEYLHFKLYSKQLTTPVALMTSQVNSNHEHVKDMCEKHGWFHRPKDAFMFFKQPLVPAFTENCEWCLEAPLKLLLKPGGHGVIWKIASEAGVFDWLESNRRKKALVRQINNPIAGTDSGLIAFSGIGHQEDKLFGFASCERQVNAKEGMNVIRIAEGKDQAKISLSNVEYCDFQKYGICDVPKKENGEFSKFPSNTNLLFVDLKAVRDLSLKVPMPGRLVNFREGAHYCKTEGRIKEKIARVETLMQNIAEGFEVACDVKEYEKAASKIPTFLTYNVRRKTISATKMEQSADARALETPKRCFVDVISNGYELLTEYAKMKVPKVTGNSRASLEEPPFILKYHPALGPLYSIIGQKIQGGMLAPGSELRLEIADLHMLNLDLNGSCMIHADQVMGHLNEKGILVYSEMTGKCILKDVSIENQGIDFSKSQKYWEDE
ncbi:MAG: UTP--glucose-1-phosphate uridylyltransferase, partial [Simkaniaceae bacterium]|nr:UTP--glucose-1-phosphate uridylyltransferase [Simkaniaceae bacterium]